MTTKIELSDEQKVYSGNGFRIYRAGGSEKDRLVIIAETAGGVPSSTGKMMLTANSGGFCSIPGTDIRVNLCVGTKR